MQQNSNYGSIVLTTDINNLTEFITYNTNINKKRDYLGMLNFVIDNNSKINIDFDWDVDNMAFAKFLILLIQGKLNTQIIKDIRDRKDKDALLIRSLLLQMESILEVSKDQSEKSNYRSGNYVLDPEDIMKFDTKYKDLEDIINEVNDNDEK